MLHYLCYFIEKDGSSAAWRGFQSESEGDAHDYALGLLVAHSHADRVEVWNSSRLTFAYSRSAAKTPGELRRLCYLAIAAAKKETDPKFKQIIASRAAALAQEAEALERSEPS